MIAALLLWTGLSAAASCCASAGLAPTALASCDQLGVALGVGGDLETGAWAWGGAWSGVGDDGGGTGTASLSALGRATPWLQLGLRLPLQLSVDTLDGQRDAGLGLGQTSAWLIVEAPPGWPSDAAPVLGLELGLRGQPAEQDGHGHLSAALGARIATAPAAWGIWGGASLEQPLAGGGARSADGALTVDHALGPRARLGLAAHGQLTLGAFPALQTAAGPALSLSPRRADRLVLAALLGPPLSGAGWNAPSSLQVTVEWLSVLRPAPSGA